jgi:hypothetical protein
MRVSYRLELAGSGSTLTAQQRGALWLAGGRIAVYGRDLTAAGGGKLSADPAGVTLINTRDWSACTLDERASRATVAAGRLLTYGPGSPVSRREPGIGLRAYAVDRREVFHLFEGEQVWDVKVVAGDAYVRTATAVHVVDVRSGKFFATIARPPELAAVIGGAS